MTMTMRRLMRPFGFALAGALVLAAAPTSDAHEQHQNHHSKLPHIAASADLKGAAGLIKVVRESTERFRDVAVAEAEGYSLMFGCVAGPDDGAMGLHYVNLSLVGDPALDPTRPEIVIYEPLPDGKLQLIGADFLVFADAWHARQTDTPQIMGQLMHLFEAPNRFGLPAFYTLHVWAWKENPKGAFVNWHPKVSCNSFGG